MDNYQIAINGISLAARILGIDTPDVQFFYNQDLTKKGINSILLKDEYVIAFNEEWIDVANTLEVQVTCFHESRHAFQWKCINGNYSGEDYVDPNMIEIWGKEMSSYNQPTRKDIPEDFYLKQEIEIDAIAFVHFQMKKLFNVKSVIPEAILDEVQALIKDLNRRY